MKSVNINVKGLWFFKKGTSKVPFGMTMPGRSYNAHTLRHGFTGHEKESDLAKGIYTTEYRLYDAREGRWLSVDPLFEKYVGMSPYNYCMLNPLVMVDPDGRECHNFFPNNYQTIRVESEIELSKLAEDRMYDIISERDVKYCETDRNAFQCIAQFFDYENDNALHIAGHGVDEGQFFQTNDIIIASSDMIQKLNTKDYDIIVLHSCETGKESSQYNFRFVKGVPVKPAISFANAISKELPDKYIVAPSEIIKFGVDNTDDCEMFNPFEYVNGKSGTWNIWQNGKVVSTFSGLEIPTSDVIRESIRSLENGE